MELTPHGKIFIHYAKSICNLDLESKKALDVSGRFTSRLSICLLYTSYTKEFSGARDYLKQRMAEAGLKVHEDPAGNIIGRYPGKVERPAVMTGSHFDTVFHGGNFDGQAGVCAALEAARVMSENHIRCV